MPRQNTDLSEQIEAIIREATGRIVALLEGEREAMLESVQMAVSALDSTLQDRPGLSDALRANLSATSSKAASTKRPPRDQWVRTADVVVELRSLLSARRDGARIAELRDETQFTDMQLHRALRQLRDAGEVSKEGELRRTVYRYTGRRQRKPAAKKKATPKRAASRKPPARKKSGTRTPARRAKPRAQARPPRAQWVSTDDVKKAARKALRRRKKGMHMSDLCEVTGYTDKQLYRALVALVDDGTVERVGRLRNMRYVLSR